MFKVLIGGGADEISSYNIGWYGHASKYYTTTCFGPGYWRSSGCSQLIDQLYNLGRILQWGGDEISFNNIWFYGPASQYYTITCFGLGYWPFSGCHNLLTGYTIFVGYHSGGEEASSYNIGRFGQASQFYTTICFGPT